MESREEKFERWAKEWDDKLPNLAKALRSKDLQDNLAFIENFNPMNTPISPELSAQIEREAEAYMESSAFTSIEVSRIHLKYAYRTAAKQYALQFEQAKKALERIDQMPNPRNRIQYKEFVALVKTIAANTLATWKEEGKPETETKTT